MITVLYLDPKYYDRLHFHYKLPCVILCHDVIVSITVKHYTIPHHRTTSQLSIINHPDQYRPLDHRRTLLICTKAGPKSEFFPIYTYHWVWSVKKYEIWLLIILNGHWFLNPLSNQPQPPICRISDTISVLSHCFGVWSSGAESESSPPWNTWFQNRSSVLYLAQHQIPIQ